MLDLKEENVYIKFCCRLGKTAKLLLLKLAFREETLSRTEGFLWFPQFQSGIASFEDSMFAALVFDTEFATQGQTVNRHFSTDVLWYLQKDMQQSKLKNGLLLIGFFAMMMPLLTWIYLCKNFCPETACLVVFHPLYFPDSALCVFLLFSNF
jgi:hypothetical protein